MRYFHTTSCFIVEILDDDGSLASEAVSKKIYPILPKRHDGNKTIHYYAMTDAIQLRKLLNEDGEEYNEIPEYWPGPSKRTN